MIVLIALSVAFVGNAVRELSRRPSCLSLPRGLPRLPIFLADLTGFHPTLQSLVAQAALAAVYIAGAIWMFVIMPARERRRRPCADRRADPGSQARG